MSNVILCGCGCGQEVKGRYQRTGGGWREQRFVSSAHALRVNHRVGGWDGRQHTEESKQKIAAARFKGDKATTRTGRGRAEQLFAAGPCIICGQRGERHHIDGNTLNNQHANVALLCRSHHRQIHPGNGPRPLRPLAELWPRGGDEPSGERR